MSLRRIIQLTGITKPQLSQILGINKDNPRITLQQSPSKDFWLLPTTGVVPYSVLLGCKGKGKRDIPLVSAPTLHLVMGGGGTIKLSSPPKQGLMNRIDETNEYAFPNYQFLDVTLEVVKPLSENDYPGRNYLLNLIADWKRWFDDEKGFLSYMNNCVFTKNHSASLENFYGLLANWKSDATGESIIDRRQLLALQTILTNNKTSSSFLPDLIVINSTLAERSSPQVKSKITPKERTEIIKKLIEGHQSDWQAIINHLLKFPLSLTSGIYE